MADPTTTEPELTRPLCRLDDLEDGHSRGFDPLGEGRDTMFVVRKGARLFAWRNACPHYDRARMAWKKNEFMNGDRTSIMCAAHGAMFDIETGVCTIGPCLGQSLRKVEIAVRDGMVFLIGTYAPGLAPRPGRRHSQPEQHKTMVFEERT